jgi:PleD family two-component response regulator
VAALNKTVMEQIKKVLVIGRHPAMLKNVLELLKEKGYDTVGASTNEAAIAAFREGTIQAVVIGGGVDAESRTLFHTLFKDINPSAGIIDAHPETILPQLKAFFSDK